MSNRYSQSFSIAEAINVIANRKNEETKRPTFNSKRSPPKKEPLKELVKSGQKVNPDEIFNSNKESITESTLTKSTRKKDSLEKELPEKPSTDSEKKVFNVNYSPEAEFLLNGIYNPNSLDYVKLFYGCQGAIKFKENDYTILKNFSDTEDKSISSLEAEAIIVKVQYAMTMNNRDEVDFKSRRNLSNWFTFNSVLGMFYHRLHGVTDEVNYSRVF